MIRENSVLVIAKLTFREASRRWVLWVALLLGLLFLAVYAIGFHEIKRYLRNVTAIATKRFITFCSWQGFTRSTSSL
jgi:hypothetical protein